MIYNIFQTYKFISSFFDKEKIKLLRYMEKVLKERQTMQFSSMLLTIECFVDPENSLIESKENSFFISAKTLGN